LTAVSGSEGCPNVAQTAQTEAGDVGLFPGMGFSALSTPGIGFLRWSRTRSWQDSSASASEPMAERSSREITSLPRLRSESLRAGAAS
jgi:hypothetical protein